MRIKLSYKFFIAFLLTSVISIVLMVVIMDFYLHKNFVGFINKMDMEILNVLGDKLRMEYKTEQGWDRLKNNRRFWRKLLHAIHDSKDFDRLLPPPNFRRDGKNRNERKPPRHPPFWDDKPPPKFKHNSENKNEQPPPPNFKRRGGPFRRVTLFDAQKNRVVGNNAPLKHHQLQSVIVEGKIVGWLGMHKIKHLSRPREIEFLKQQTNGFYLIGSCILLMTALVAWWLSRHLLIPIQQLTKGTQALTSRQFKTKIKIHSNDELGQLADDFNIMAQTLEKYEKMRQQWLSDISHELRTPLAIMRGEIEAMQDGIREFNSENLDSLHFEVQRISRLVNDLHELSLAEAHTLTLQKEPINPLQILQETLKLFQTQLVQHHILIQDNLSTDSLFLQGNTDRLSQLFSNLLENTLRYVDSPGTLKIDHEQTKTQLSISFIDSGPGVPEESIERLFDRLYRVEQSRNRAKGGSGLGLAICKNIVEMHGGKITATNVPSGGLWIKIIFPLID